MHKSVYVDRYKCTYQLLPSFPGYFVPTILSMTRYVLSSHADIFPTVILEPLGIIQVSSVDKIWLSNMIFCFGSIYCTKLFSFGEDHDTITSGETFSFAIGVGQIWIKGAEVIHRLRIVDAQGCTFGNECIYDRERRCISDVICIRFECKSQDRYSFASAIRHK